MGSLAPLIDFAQNTALHAAPTMPIDYWWITFLVFLILLLTALIDAKTGIVPDGWIFIGLAVVTGTLGLAVSWEVAAQHLRHAIGAALVIWAINAGWYAAFHHDALGMGDAKWSMLAVSCFGVMPVLLAWGIGAILAIFFIGIAHLARRKITHVTFAPFLCAGLIAGIYWVGFAPLNP